MTEAAVRHCRKAFLRCVRLLHGCGSGEREQQKTTLGALRGSGFCSVLQHGLVALEHTLGDLWSSAFQRDLVETETLTT